jgi:metal-responsive CopG/Arc/MetJ family transcriptional regulator
MSKHRLQLDFTGKALEDLDSLREVTELPNRAEVIRQALRLLQWTVQETHEQGGTILLEKNGSQREVIFPFWSNKPSKPESKSKVELVHEGSN